MPLPPRKIAFILAATDHGSMIVNRFDYHFVAPGHGFGVGFSLLENSHYERVEGDTAFTILSLRRDYFGDGVVALDCGANIGVHTVEWARRMTGWGTVIAIEAQERIFYALAGNITLNNCFNARAIHAAIGAQPGSLRIATPDYLAPASFGSFELKASADTEFIGQNIDYNGANTVEIHAITVDSLNLPRLDLIKIDVERMELEVLQGAEQTIARCRPVIIVEKLKTAPQEIAAVLGAHGYRLHELGGNFLAIHETDSTGRHVTAAPS